MRIKLDLSKEKQILESIISFFIRLYSTSSYKKYVNKKALERLSKERKEWFEKKYKVSVDKVRSLMMEIETIKPLDVNLRKSSELFNPYKKFLPPNFVDFDVIDIHNENCDENQQTLSEIKSKDYKETEKILGDTFLDTLKVLKNKNLKY